MGLSELVALTHALENVLDGFRVGALHATAERITVLLRGVDVATSFVEAHSAGLEPPDAVTMAHVIETLVECMRTTNTSQVETAGDCAPEGSSVGYVIFDDDADASGSSNDGAPAPAPSSPTATEPLATDPKAHPSSQDGSLRVSVATLDKLMTLAGEMVLTRNQLLQSTSMKDLYLIERATQLVDLITTEMQDAIMSTRMQSVGMVFQRMHRIVRDVARITAKDVRLVLDGEDVELDKTIIEAIPDPMVHLVRNAVDHGIESSDERRRAGKATTGTLRLSASHKAGQVVIEIADDGSGVSPATIRQRALEMGLHTAEELAAMGDKALLKLLFRSGFSTAARVSEISGRGVGLDVVCANLARVGGVCDIESTPGRGTTIRMTLPLTLAILPSLLVEAEGERFAIPQVNLLELQRVRARDVAKRIQRIGSADVIQIRGVLLPLVRLRDVLGIKNPTYAEANTGQRLPDARADLVDRRAAGMQEHPIADPDRRSVDERRTSPASAVNIVVVAAGDLHYGIIVDSLLDSAEIVVKPLGRHLRECRCYAGATVLGDGRAALILDVVGISQAAGIADAVARDIKKSASPTQTIVQKHDKLPLLLVENAPLPRMGIPLDLIERIERIGASEVQTIGGRRVFKHRGRSVPVFSISDASRLGDLSPRHRYFAVIFTVRGREMGYLASEIVDVVTTTDEIDEVTHRQPGVLGSTILGGDITLLLDPVDVVAHAAPEWTVPPTARHRSSSSERILLVEDSPFFRARIRDIVVDGGFEVTVAESIPEALDAMRGPMPPSVAVVDLEMLATSGRGLPDLLRNELQGARLPIVALTTHLADARVTELLDLGISEVHPKLDRARLLAALTRLTEAGRAAA